MLNYIYILVCFLCLKLIHLNYCIGQTVKRETDIKKDDLKGNVKTVNQYVYNAFEKFGEIILDSSSIELDENYIKLYNTNGYIIDETKYNSNGSPQRFVYSIDDWGNIIEKSHYDSNNKLINDFKKIYNLKNKIIEEKKFHCTYIWVYNKSDALTEFNTYNTSGELIERKTLTYDSKGNHIETYHYKSDGLLSHRYTYKYDYNGEKIEFKIYNSANKLDYSESYKYDEKGKILELIMLTTEGSLNSKSNYYYDDDIYFDKKIDWRWGSCLRRTISYKYNSQNKLVEKSEKFCDWPPISKDIYTYNSENRLIEWKYFISESYMGRRTYKYDKYGQWTEEAYYDSNNNVRRKDFYKYEYDLKGNWIKLTKSYFEPNSNFGKTVPEKIKIRKINYY